MNGVDTVNISTPSIVPDDGSFLFIATLETWPSGAAATVTITVQILGSANKESITNTAVVSLPNFDPNPANNSASVKTLVFGNKRL